MIECLHLGKGKEAVNVSRHALSLDSSNPGLIGNLALSYPYKWRHRPFKQHYKKSSRDCTAMSK